MGHIADGRGEEEGERSLNEAVNAEHEGSTLLAHQVGDSRHAPRLPQVLDDVKQQIERQHEHRQLSLYAQPDDHKDD
eukprot:CAMPEP_0174749126 /NCGR_PEP_ID=MMETSP1094-20130205/95043_1 /TAXON_ID=156173 /ORGANISM="Chrysochromulina brevifilum, Strain UTEX LB 985" /LENGTH=76 /DNA_ID=CAMNT_0015954287 /DNA_START=67 /DNA_END=294 /DNA_ORIENTATION=+